MHTERVACRSPGSTMPSQRDLVEQQLRKQLRFLGSEPPEKPQTLRYVFPWSCAWTLAPQATDAMMRLMCARPPKTHLARCPIYRSLPRHLRHELILRGPKSFLHYQRFAWGLLRQAVDAYPEFTPGGVSPLTAMALLVPEPRFEIRQADLSPRLVIPEVPVIIDSKTGRPATRRTSEWQVVLWALKRYVALSWRNLASLSTDIRRGPTSLRQTIRRNVEEPLAAFYRCRTGRDLEQALYSSALGDSPQSEEWSRRRMRELKKAARAKLDENPTNKPS